MQFMVGVVKDVENGKSYETLKFQGKWGSMEMESMFVCRGCSHSIAMKYGIGSYVDTVKNKKM